MFSITCSNGTGKYLLCMKISCKKILKVNGKINRQARASIFHDCP